MAAFDIGAVIAVFASGNFDKSKNRVSIFNDWWRFSKCFYCLLQLPHFYSSPYFMVDCRLWSSFAEMLSQILIAKDT